MPIEQTFELRGPLGPLAVFYILNILYFEYL